MKCPNCQTENSSDAVRCSACGASLQDARETGRDIHSQSFEFASYPVRQYVRDTDRGRILQDRMEDLLLLLDACRRGIINLQKQA